MSTVQFAGQTFTCNVVSLIEITLKILSVPVQPTLFSLRYEF